MARQLRSVEAMPDERSAQLLPGLSTDALTDDGQG
jgi:hypothetical protein